MRTLMMEGNLFEFQVEKWAYELLTWVYSLGIIVFCLISLKFTLFSPKKTIFSTPLVCVCKSQWPENIKGIDSKVLENFCRGYHSAGFLCRVPGTWSHSLKGAWGSLCPTTFSGSDVERTNPYHSQIRHCFAEYFFLKVSHKFFVCKLLPSPAKELFNFHEVKMISQRLLNLNPVSAEQSVLLNSSQKCFQALIVDTYGAGWFSVHRVERKLFQFQNVGKHLGSSFLSYLDM